VLLQREPEGAGGEPERDVDRGEAGDEQRRPGQQPAAVLPLEVDTRESGDVAEVAGHEWEHARGQERHQTGGDGDRYGEEQ
jgi:hypothetical protein